MHYERLSYPIILFPRLFTTRSTQLPVMCGALGALCMRSGVSDTSRLKAIIMLRYDDNFRNHAYYSYDQVHYNIYMYR